MPAEEVDSPVASVEVVVETVEVAVAVTVEEKSNLMPQTASASNVNGIFLASHSEVCRWMESRQSLAASWLGRQFCEGKLTSHD